MRNTVLWRMKFLNLAVKVWNPLVKRSSSFSNACPRWETTSSVLFPGKRTPLKNQLQREWTLMKLIGPCIKVWWLSSNMIKFQRPNAGQTVYHSKYISLGLALGLYHSQTHSSWFTPLKKYCDEHLKVVNAEFSQSRECSPAYAVALGIVSRNLHRCEELIVAWTLLKVTTLVRA